MTENKRRDSVIIGAGPAGLTAAYELVTRSSIRPIVLEATDQVGGIARTVEYKGNRIDIGGHRFFSKSDRVMQWWLEMLPLAAAEGGALRLAYHRQTHVLRAPAGGAEAAAQEDEDRVMLVRPRRSRIYTMRAFFDYPLSLSADTLRKLGLARSFRIAASYARSLAAPIRPERNLEEFFINRFGRELYTTFFKAYTEKVWGAACAEISAEWGGQRVKGLSMRAALAHALARPFRRRGGLEQRQTETSLIEQFLYPKYGPGQLWQEAARRVEAAGGQILLGWRACEILTRGAHVETVRAVHAQTGRTQEFAADSVISSMPLKDLVPALSPPAPPALQEIARGLVYRDFITVGLLLRRLKVCDREGGAAVPIRDNWIYIQDPDVRVGRVQVFNNWSPCMVADPATTWLGLEYFCTEGDEIWARSDARLAALAVDELERIGFIDRADMLDSVVIRMTKTYPAYFGAYARLGELRAWLDPFENLFVVGRSGMHRYNNQDHSMLTAMAAVDLLLSGRADKSEIWSVNTEEEYHETRARR